MLALNLNARIRELMVEEIERDVSLDTLYISPRLNTRGTVEYLELLLQAARTEDDESLADRLRLGRLKEIEATTRRGRQTTAKVPVTAPETLAEGEFNRFYARAVCRMTIEEGGQEVEVFRAKAVSQPRPESQALIGRRLDAAGLLDDLRMHQGMKTLLGLPAGPNSGLSVRALPVQKIDSGSQ